MLISEIAAELDKRSHDRPIGALQDLRKTLKGHSRRVPGRIFGAQTVKERWAFHLGGRAELQFNIGFEDRGDGDLLRYGVAFSLEPSRTLPDVAALFPKIARFNEYLRVYPDPFADLRMWHYAHGTRSDEYSPSAIPPERALPHTFVFLGQQRSRHQIDFDAMLDVFDRLLPLYEFVESSIAIFPLAVPEAAGLQFKPGCRIKRLVTTATSAQQQLDILLRHNALEMALHGVLAKRFGHDHVGTELPTGTGTRVDVAVRHPKGDVWLYEIKTDLSARACVRAAIAQLLEYAFWPTATRATRLVVVGEPELDASTGAYLRGLRADFGLPIYYSQLDEAARTLVESPP